MTGTHETQWEPRLQPNSLEAGGSKRVEGFCFTNQYVEKFNQTQHALRPERRIPRSMEKEIAAYHPERWWVLLYEPVCGFIHHCPHDADSIPLLSRLFSTDVNRNAQRGPWVRLKVAYPPARS